MFSKVTIKKYIHNPVLFSMDLGNFMIQGPFVRNFPSRTASDYLTEQFLLPTPWNQPAGF